MRDVGKNVGNYSINLAVITDSEENLTCTIVQYKKYWSVIGRFDTTLKMFKPDKEQFFIKQPGSRAIINGSNRTALSKLRKHPRFGKSDILGTKLPETLTAHNSYLRPSFARNS